MSKSRISLTKGQVTPDKRFASSNLLHYGYASQDSTPSNKGSKEKTINNPKDITENISTADSTTSKMGSTMDARSNYEENSKIPRHAHLNLSETQLSALSYSLSELAEKISPTKNEFIDEDEWQMRASAEGLGIERTNSIGRSKGEHPSSHSKTPYTKSRRHEAKHPLSKQKSFSKNKPLLSSQNENEVRGKSSSGAVLHQESVESGYNSSWSSNSFNEEKSSADTDIEEESVFSDTNADKYDENALETKITDVEKRINSLILGRRTNEQGTETEVKPPTDEKVNEYEKVNGKENVGENDKINRNVEKTHKNDELSEKLQSDDSGGTQSDQNMNDILKSPGGDNDLKKSPFQVHKVRKASLDEGATHAQKPVRPGLVRRRTTLVTFRPPRKAAAFSEIDDSGVLEIDEAGFVQCLTDVRSMKTMLLKLKRELQEAEVQSPLTRSVSAMSRSTVNLANTAGLNDISDEGSRRHTYDSSEMIQKKLQRIRCQSISRRKNSSCAESPLEDVSAVDVDGDADTPITPEVTSESINSNEEMKRMKEELDDLREKMKDIKQERDTLLMDKEEIEHEMEAKSHTIKMLQKQLEAQENSDEVACLKRQVTALTQQVRQQQQKISELKYAATSPRKDPVKLDIKHRLRDAFARHLEESSKSHLLLSKHIEKAEFTISEAQKGLKSLCFTPSQNLTQDDEPSGKKRSPTNMLGTPRNSLGTPRVSEDKTRRHSWTVNSIDKIIKTWKDTAHSIENLANKSPKTPKKSSKLPQPSSPHLSFL